MKMASLTVLYRQVYKLESLFYGNPIVSVYQFNSWLSSTVA